MISAVHPFEKANLGKAPFRCTGSFEAKYQACQGAPIQPGTSCDYCGQGIMTAFVIKSADEHKFKVGCDCVGKVYRDCAGTDAEREMRAVVDHVNKLKTAAANKRKDDRIAAARALLETNRDNLRARIWDGVVRHSNGPQSVADHLDWMLNHGGRALKMRGVALVDNLVTEGQ